ncbi:MAG: polysaccharide export protein, partial [Sphingomonas bacterium]|nr:polysaccharide export protein [Sphingomonas bacterium]
AEYTISAGDTVDVKVFQEADLDSRVVVSKDGKISLSLVGEVSVLGLSNSAAARTIEAKYKQGYLVHPKVTVSTFGYAKRRFTVLGAVNKPGSFYFPDTEAVTILQAVGMAGGYSKVANPSKVTVKRGTAGETIKLDLKKMAKDTEAKPFVVQPGDTFTVGESLL